MVGRAKMRGEGKQLGTILRSCESSKVIEEGYRRNMLRTNRVGLYGGGNAEP